MFALPNAVELLKEEPDDVQAGSTAFQDWLLDNLDLFASEDLAGTPQPATFASQPISHSGPSWGDYDAPPAGTRRASLPHAANSLPAALEPCRPSRLRLQAGGSLQSAQGRTIKTELCNSQSAPMPDAGRPSGRFGKQPILPKPKRYTSKAQKEAHQRFREKKRTELQTLEQEVQDKLHMLQQLEAENSQLRSRSRVLAASVDCSQETLGLLHDLQQLQLTDSMRMDQAPAVAQGAGWAHAAGGAFHSSEVQQLGSGKALGAGALAAGNGSGACLFSNGSLSSISTATVWSGPCELPGAADAAMWDIWRQQPQQQQQQQQMPHPVVPGPEQLFAEEYDELLVPQQPQQQHWATAELVAQPPVVQLFRDVADALSTYRQYIDDASDALQDVEGPCADPQALARLEALTANMMRRYRMWFLSSKDALKALYSYKQRNLETGQEAEPNPGFWEHVLALLQLRPDQQQDLLSCQAMFAMASSKAAGAWRVLAAQLVAALPVQPDADDGASDSSGELLWCELGASQPEAMAWDGSAAACATAGGATAAGGAAVAGEAAAAAGGAAAGEAGARAAAVWDGSLAHIQSLLRETQSNLTRACFLDRLFNMAVMRVLTPLQQTKTLVHSYPFVPCYHSMIAALTAQVQQQEYLQQQQQRQSQQEDEQY